MTNGIAEAEEEAADAHCTSCGKAEIGDIELQDCDKCNIARYCSDECQKNDRQIHGAICKERAAELRDVILFRQNESTHLGDCPICFLPLPLGENKFGVYPCCGKEICRGCIYANLIREREQRLKHKCPFCRKLFAKTDEEIDKNNEKRVAADDPFALARMGRKHYKEGEYESAFKYLTRAAGLGDAMAHHDLSIMYEKGHGVNQDEERARYHCEEAAIAGNPYARHYLAWYEAKNERSDRAVKHLIIAANLGHDGSIQALKKCYKDKDGHVNKDDFAAALRAHQASVDAMKSPQRDAAARHYDQFSMLKNRMKSGSNRYTSGDGKTI